jgi:anaerobic selenocysteine-containing dehydrogenase
MIRTSEVMIPRLENQLLIIHHEDGDKLGLVEGARAEITIGDESYTGLIKLDARVPKGVILVPRSMGIPLAGPVNAEIKGLD